MITKEQKQKSLDALRAGEYEQAEGLLRRSDYCPARFCCLGVACEVIGPGVDEQEEYSSATWFGDANSAQIEVMRVAMSRNDDGTSFSDIADYLERELVCE